MSSLGTKVDSEVSEDPHQTDSYDESSYPANAESDSESEGQQISQVQPLQLSSKLKDNPDASVNQYWLKSRGQGEGPVESTILPPLSDDFSCAVCSEVFVEPCTLHCGHSFCQLCLAGLWRANRKSPLYLYCPLCRQPWVNFPGVNIQLR